MAVCDDGDEKRRSWRVATLYICRGDFVMIHCSSASPDFCIPYNWLAIVKMGIPHIGTRGKYHPSLRYPIPNSIEQIPYQASKILSYFSTRPYFAQFTCNIAVDSNKHQMWTKGAFGKSLGRTNLWWQDLPKPANNWSLRRTRLGLLPQETYSKRGICRWWRSRCVCRLRIRWAQRSRRGSDERSGG